MRRFSVLALLSLLVTMMPSVPAAAFVDQVDRVAGPERITTAVAASSYGFEQADTVVLARADEFPDALAAGPLARSLDAPILLTGPDRAAETVMAEIDRLGAQTAVIVGGDAVIEDSVVEQLTAAGLQVERIAGPSRFDTAVAVASRLGAPSGQALLTLGEDTGLVSGWADALSSAAFGLLDQDIPLLLTRQAAIPATTLQALDDLDVTDVTIIGGPAAVSATVADQLRAAGHTVTRLAGGNRFETSATVLDHVVTQPAFAQVDDTFGLVAATGANFPDGLTAGGLTGALNGAAVLVPNTNLDAAPQVVSVVSSLASRIDPAVVLGGPAAVGDDVLNRLNELLSDPTTAGEGVPEDEAGTDTPGDDGTGGTGGGGTVGGGGGGDGGTGDGGTGGGGGTGGTVINPPPLMGQSGAPTFADQISFLYSGPDPVQTGVDVSQLSIEHLATFSGFVLDRQGDPVPGAVVTVLGHDEFGQTTTRDDGRYDMAVNGGQVLTITVEADGFLSVQRTADLPWSDYHVLEDIVLTPLDAAVTTIDIAAGGTHVSSMSSDDDGDRQVTMVFPPDTAATMHLPDGSTQPLSSLDVRATEYTVGPDGQRAMPADLPPSTEYTYAVELSVDQALAADATKVTFDQPVAVHIDDFLGFPAGVAVPVGFYDTQDAAWKPIEAGLVIGVVVNDGTAELDLNGDDVADDTDDVIAAEIGLTDQERDAIGARFTEGQTLWRFRTDHFSSFDCNYASRPRIPNQAPDPNNPNGTNPPCKQQGSSVIRCEDQTLGESFALTPEVSISYDSARVPAVGRSITIPVTGDDPLPPELTEISVEIIVAGKRTTRTFVPTPGLSTSFTWDGLDAFGREVPGGIPITVVYRFVYDFGYEVGRFGEPPSSATVSSEDLPSGRTARELASRWRGTLGALDPRVQGLGGWTLDQHHAYDVSSGRVLLGSGDTVSREGGPFAQAQMIALGNEFTSTTPSDHVPDGANAYDARVDFCCAEPAIGADGSIYVSTQHFEDSSLYHHLRRITADGTLDSVAGSGPEGYSGDGGPAVDAEVSEITSIALHPDGSIWFAQAGDESVIRRVGVDGVITTVVGGRDRYDATGDDGPAVEAGLRFASDLEIAPDGTVFIADDDRVRRVGPDGIISTYTGGGDQIVRSDGGGGVPQNACLDTPCGRLEVDLLSVDEIELATDGTLYVATNQTIGRVTTDGQFQQMSDGDGGTIRAQIGMAIGAGDDLFFRARSGAQIQRIDLGNPGAGPAIVAGTPSVSGLQSPPRVPTLPPAAYQSRLFHPQVSPSGELIAAVGRGIAVLTRPYASVSTLPTYDLGEGLRAVLPEELASQTTYAIPHPDGSQIWAFADTGRHVATVDAATKAILWRFGYSSDGLLTSASDAFGQVTTISRPDDTQVLIEDSFGRQLQLTLDSDGWLDTITDFAGRQRLLQHSVDGLLELQTDPAGNDANYTWNDEAQLERAVATDGTTFVLDQTDDGASTLSIDGETSTYRSETQRDGTVLRSFTDPSGLTTQTTQTLDGVVIRTVGSATREVTFQPDPRFGDDVRYPAESVMIEGSAGTVRSTLERVVDLADPLAPLDYTTVTDTVTNPRDGDLVSVYDAESRTTTVTLGDGTTQELELTPEGLPARLDVGTGIAPYLYTYDARGQIAQMGQTGALDTFAYDDRGNLATTTDPDGDVTSYGYDAADRRTSLTTPDGHTTQFDHDVLDNRDGWTMPAGQSHTLNHTAFGQRTGYQPPLASTSESLTYGDARGLQDEQHLDGSVTDYTVIDRQLRGISNAGGATTIEYGGTSRPDDPWTTLSRTPTRGDALVVSRTYFSGLLRTQQTTAGQGLTHRYSYSELRVAERRLDSGDTITFTYDGAGQRATAGGFTYERDPAGLLSALDDGNTRLERSRGDRGEDEGTRLVHIDSPDVVVSELDQEVDAEDRVSARTLTIGDDPAETQTFTHDADGQLAAVQDGEGNVVELFSYDGNGNRTGHTVGGTQRVATYDDRDRIIARDGISYDYDENGFVSRIGELLLDYLPTGELVSAQDVPGAPVSYGFDGLGRLSERTNASGTTGFIYGDEADDLKLTASVDPAGVRSQYLYTEDSRLFAVLRNGSRYGVMTDGVGSPLVVVDDTGTIVLERGYSAFGELLSESGSFDLPLGFGGGIADSVTGLVRFGMRDYEPASGRWTAPDPALLGGQDPNLYRYVSNDPVSRRDPSGLIDISGVFCFGACGSASVQISSEGFSACLGFGVGIGGGLGVNLAGGPKDYGTSVNVEVGIGPASVNLDIPLVGSPCARPTLGNGLNFAAPLNLKVGALAQLQSCYRFI
ncbi:MAG: cell wall-binding repeat-containing protein [Euzebya sp.]